jgi:hypothetical protein
MAYKTSTLVARVGPVRGGETSSVRVSGRLEGPPEVVQGITGLGQARQAMLGKGTQNVYFGDPGAQGEAAVSIAPPVGQRDPGLPLRGRDGLLAELADAGLGAVRVVHGLGGCGKTRLALEAAWRAQERAVEVWWVSAADQSRLVAGMRAVGRRLGATDAELRHGEAADLVWQRLSGRHQPWLLVLDNADDPQLLAGPDVRVVDGTGWLRPVKSASGMILVTSRDGRPASWASWCRLHLVGMLSAGDATQVLEDYAGRRAVLGGEAESAALAERLGRLPLALKIAGSYLAEAAGIPAAFALPGLPRTYRQYEEAVEEGQLDIAFPAPGGSQLTSEQARGVIGLTWELTLDLLDTRQLPEARKILRLLASMADAPVPHELVLRPERLSESPLLAGITGPRVWHALQALAGFGLIELGGSGDRQQPVTRLHPLVRDASRSSRGDLAGQWDQAAATLVEAAIPAQTWLPETWPACAVLLPHAQALLDLTSDGMWRIATYLGSSGNYLAARDQFQLITNAYRDDDAYGPEHQDTLAARNQLARWTGRAGDAAAARDQLSVLLPIDEQLLGPEHPETLAARGNLVHWTGAAGDAFKARDQGEALLPVIERILGLEHPDTLAVRADIAHWIRRAKRRGVRGQMDPDTLVVRADSPRGPRAARGATRAANQYAELLPVVERVLGTDHPVTLEVRAGLAWSSGEAKDGTGARDQFDALLPVTERVLGTDHPVTLDVRAGIARWTGSKSGMGDASGARDQFAALLPVYERILGPGHPDTLYIRHSVARWTGEAGDSAGARDQYKALLSMREQILGPEHPDTQVARNNLARWTKMAGSEVN